MNRKKLKGHILILVTAVLFAINIPVCKYLLPSHVPPEGLTIMRMLFACIMFWIVSLFTKYEKVTLKDLGILLVCSLCGVGLNQGLFIVGLSRTSPVDAAIINTAVPIYVLLLAAVVLKEPITLKKAGGVFLGIIGGLLLIFSSSQLYHSNSSLEGNIMLIVSGMMYAIFLVISKPISQRYSAITIMKWMFLFTTCLLLPFTYKYILSTPAFHRPAIDWGEISAIFFVLFGATFLPYLLIPMAQKRIRPTTISMYNYLQTIIAAFLAIAVGQDSFSFYKVIATVFVFAGVYLVTQSKSREDVEREKEAKEK
ncbi:MAG: DMT family transporter [Parabacteroides sp.]|nr:DMT family transporter [Parabacteroides sp.]